MNAIAIRIADRMVERLRGRDDFEERAAIIQFDAGMTRADAERAAATQIASRKAR